MELLISEQNGWTKSFEVQKGVTRIGNLPTNDISLSAPTIAPLHLQIFYSPQQPQSCKVLNLGTEILISRQGNQQKLDSYTTIELGGGDELSLDVYKIALKLPVSTGIMRSSSSIEASLLFAETVLHPDMLNVGILSIKNTGKKQFCQFRVHLSGLTGDCFQIDPAPLMHPDAQEQLHITLFHRGLYPKAGFQEIKLSVSAPESYPGEEVVICQGIYVMPFFDIALELHDDLPAHEIIIEGSKSEHSSQALDSLSVHSVEKASPADLATDPIVISEPATTRPIDRIVKLESPAVDDYWNESSTK